MDPIEEELRGGFRFLYFKPALEAQFEADTSHKRCKSLMIAGFIGLLVYHMFLISDYTTLSDAFSTNLLMHFGVVTPLVLAIEFVVAHRPSPAVRELAAVLIMIVLPLTVALVAGASRSPVRDIVIFYIVLHVFYGVVVLRLRFWYALMGTVIAQIVYSVGLAAITPFSMDRAVLMNVVFAGIAAFSLIGCYNYEREMRTGYLLRLRDRIRNRDLEAISLQDALTGIGNRRALDAALEAAAERSLAEPARSTAVLVLDIDHFKAFNDTNGHQEGDICLTRVAGLIALVLQGGPGTAFRFGGEEFVTVLEDTSLVSALDVAERIRTAVERAAIPRGPEGAAVVTVSIGVAVGRLATGSTPHALIAEADGALYTAKRRGRNVVWAMMAEPGLDASARVPLALDGALRKTG